MRPPRQLRSLRQHVEDRTGSVGRTTHIEDQAHTVAAERFLPQIAEETEQAIKTVRTNVLYYRRKRTGRRCSCFEVETSPDGSCQICYGTGFVGGWDMHGCWSEWIDVTYPNVGLVNCQADHALGIRPVPFTLENGVNLGFIETDVALVRNIGKVQTTQLLYGSKNPQNGVRVLIKATGDLDFVEMTDETLAARLQNSSIRVRIELSRSNTQVASPRFSHLMLRYALIPEVRVFGDMNLAEETHASGDLGYFDGFTTGSLIVPRSFDHFNVDDFFIRQSDLKRFKVSSLERNAVSGVLLSHTLRVRLVLANTDSIIRFP